jgi:antitoxin HicB
MLRYPVKLVRESGKVLVSFPDFPNVHTYGDDEPEALSRAADALETMLAAMIDDRERIPEPKAVRRGKAVALPALTEAKVELYRLMQAARVGKAELARRLNCHLPQIDRLLDLGHASRLDQIEQAFLALGKRLSILLNDAA